MRQTQSAWSRLSLTTALMALLSVMGASFTPQQQAWACGVNAHTLISDSAICQLPIGSELQLLMSRQSLVDLVRIGSSFPDSGYPINHDYAEEAHWSPFVEAAVRRFQARYPPTEPLSEEGLREAAFLLGAASHGLEDELFDTQFLRWTVQEDGVDQDEIDSAVDFFVIADGHTSLQPDPELPLTVAIDALRAEGVEVTREDIERGYGFIQIALGLSQRPEGAEQLAARARPTMPWSAAHYLDPEVTGSLAHEPRVISRQLELNWARLRGRFEPASALIAVSPDLMEGELLSPQAVEAQTEAGWVTLYFGVGVDVESVRERLTLLSPRGEPLPFEWRSTRWGGGTGLTRLFQLMPSEPIEPDQTLKVRVAPGVVLVGEVVTTEPWEVDVRTACAAPPCGAPSPSARRWGGQPRGCWVMDEGGAEAGGEGAPEAGVSAELGAGVASEGEGVSGAETGGLASDLQTQAGVTEGGERGDLGDEPEPEGAMSASAQGCHQAEGAATWWLLCALMLMSRLGVKAPSVRP